MSAIVFLVRHAAHELVDRVLVGRTQAVGLSMRGFQQARLLARHFARQQITCVQSSPQLRARQTAQVIADATRVPVESAADVDEVDLGVWTGRAFADLEKDPNWLRWNAQRGAARVPGGESMREVQHRMLAHLAGLCTRHRNGRIVVVSHAEPIRAGILHCRGLALDDFACVHVHPASVTTMNVGEGGIELVQENWRFDLVAAA